MYLFFLSTIGVALVIANGWVFTAIRNKKSYPSRYAQFNSIISSSLVLIVELLNEIQAYTQDNKNAIIIRRNYYSCKLWSVYLRGVAALAAFTIVEIFAEMTTNSINNPLNSHENRNQRILAHLLIFLLTWAATLGLALPSMANYSYSEHGICVNVLPFDSELFYLIYDVMFASATGIGPSIYMIHVFYRLNFCMGHLFINRRIPSGMRSHIRKIRVAFFHMVFFMMTRVPLSTVMIIRRLLKYYKIETGAVGGSVSTVLKSVQYNYWPIRMFFFLQFATQPLLTIYATFGLSTPRVLVQMGRFIRNKFMWFLTFVGLVKMQEEVDVGRRESSSGLSQISVSMIPLETFQNEYFPYREKKKGSLPKSYSV